VLKFKPTNWDAVGCSYNYNVGFNLEHAGNLLSPKTKLRQEDRENGLAGKRMEWVEQPSLYILVYEPPAKPDHDFLFHWHFRRGPSDIHYTGLSTDNQRFISPILFVDGHVARHDFTTVLKADPQYPYEQTGSWIWYQPALAPEQKQ
jgi:prepilin-type processing-associated H-X9-DG protein